MDKKIKRDVSTEPMEATTVADDTFNEQDIGGIPSSSPQMGNTRTPSGTDSAQVNRARGDIGEQNRSNSSRNDKDQSGL